MAISEFGPSGPPADPAAPTTYPLHPVDPAKIGDFWPEARLYAGDAGVAYVATEDNATAPVMVILLSQGAAADPAARDRFGGEVDRMDIDTVIARGGLDQDSAALADKFRSEDDDPQAVDAIPQAPWVALAYDQGPAAVAEAKRVLTAVGLNGQVGAPVGPDYRLHWADQDAPGSTRVWPLPWPGRRQRGGRLTILASWFLMLLLAATAVLIAILIFSQAPPTPPQPPIPSQTTGGGGSSGNPSQTSSLSSGSPSSSASSSSDTASPSPSPASPNPSGTGSAGHSNSPPLPI